MSLWLKSKENIELIEYYELERYSGEKQHRTPFRSKDEAIKLIDSLLKDRGLSINDMQAVWGTPLLQTRDDYDSVEDYPELAYHSVCHLFSSLLMDTDIFYNENILALAPDGGPDLVVDRKALEKNAYAGCYSEHGSVRMFRCSSPGRFWDNISYDKKLREGTLMALAGATSCEFTDAGDAPVFIYNGSTVKSEYNSLKNYLDNIRRREEHINKYNINRKTIGYDERFTFGENITSATMKRVQEMSRFIMYENIRNKIEKYKINPSDTYLSLSGGYALNCPTNSYLMDSFGFKGFLTPPCPNDCGQSMGIALYAFYKHMEKINFKLKTSYYGHEDNRDIKQILSEFGDYIESVEEFNPYTAVQDICEEPVVWFNGKSEIGPVSYTHLDVYKRQYQLSYQIKRP